ncbi:Transcription factor [Trichinella pseudospiralis]
MDAVAVPMAEESEVDRVVAVAEPAADQLNVEENDDNPPEENNDDNNNNNEENNNPSRGNSAEVNDAEPKNSAEPTAANSGEDAKSAATPGEEVVDAAVSKGSVPSPGLLRRSQRASAKRAQERMRGEFRDVLEGDNYTGDGLEMDYDDETGLHVGNARSNLENDWSSKPKKKRRLVIETLPDPSDCHFVIQEEDDGEVVVLSDDSEVSALHPSEIEALRAQYAKFKMSELSDEVRIERERMLNELRSLLRAEEARLVILKRMHLSQQLPVKEFFWGRKS